MRYSLYACEPVGEGLRLADQEAGVRVGDRRDVRDDAVAGGAVGRGERVRDDALLVEGLGDRLAGAAARAGGERAGEVRPALAVGRQRGLRRCPSRSPTGTCRPCRRASEVPPTAVTHAELAGVSTCFVPVLATSSPLSPEEK